MLATINPIWVFFCGVLDMIICYMVFFTFDTQTAETTEIVTDQIARMSYQVYDLIKVNETE